MAEPQGELNIDQELEELEIRLERLRSLYEQYFLGIEKAAPTVARKDVDRRIFVLRREKFRNTARRFKLQTLIQRYNTFQQYWYRICREIENGTYKRHLLRAAKNVGMTEPMTIAAKKRLGMYARRKGDDEALEAPPPTHESSPPTRAPSEAPAKPAAEPAPPPRAAPIAPVRLSDAEARPREAVERLELDIDDMFGAPAPKAPPPKAPPPKAPPPRPLPAPQPKAAPRAVPQPIQRPETAPGPFGRPPIAPRQRPETAPGPFGPSDPSRPLPPARPPPVRPRAPLPGPVSQGLSDQRVRELHGRLVDAQRQLKVERAVSVEGLAKTLREAERKLKSQHGNRKIDFDVVVKDGKAVVKPILR